MKYYLTSLLRTWDFSQTKVIMSGIIGVVITYITSFSENYLGISGLFAMTLAVIISADFITGMIAAYKKKDTFTSEKGLKTLYKTGAYLLFLFVAFSLKNEVPSGLFHSILKYFHVYLMVHICFWELFSIDENLKKMNVDLGLTGFLQSILSKIQNLMITNKKEQGKNNYNGNSNNNDYKEYDDETDNM